MIAIHRGSEILEVGVNQGSIRRFNLMKEDFIRLKFSLSENKPLLIGDYVDLTDYINSCDNENFRIKDEDTDQTTKLFVLDRNYNPTFNKNTGGWDYDVQINAYYHLWKNKIFMFNPSKGAAESSFSLTDTIFTHAALLVKNLKYAEFTYNNTEFNVAYQEEFEGQLQAKGMKPITYSAISIYGALDMIAQAFECEWWLDGGSTIYFGYRKGDEKTTLTLNNEIADVSISDSDGVHATRIYAFGGTTNVPKHYRDKLEFVADTFGEGWAYDSKRPVYVNMVKGEKITQTSYSQEIPQGSGDRRIQLHTDIPRKNVEGKISNLTSHLTPKFCCWYGDVDVEKNINLSIIISLVSGGNYRQILTQPFSIKLGDLGVLSNNEVSLSYESAIRADKDGVLQKTPNSTNLCYKVSKGKSYGILSKWVRSGTAEFMPVCFTESTDVGTQTTPYSHYKGYTGGHYFCCAYNMPADGYLVVNSVVANVYEISDRAMVEAVVDSQDFQLDAASSYQFIDIRAEYSEGATEYNQDSASEITFDDFGYTYDSEFSIWWQPTAIAKRTQILVQGQPIDVVINRDFEDNGCKIYGAVPTDGTAFTIPSIILNRVKGTYFSPEDGGVQNGVVQKNLMLPIGTNYVQADGVADADVVEAIMVYDWIYPKTALKVTDVEPFNEWKVEIEDGQTVDTTTYDITLPIEDYEDDLWVDPSNMSAIFQSGKAAGLRFELNYIKKTKNDVTFRLVPNEDYSITVPNEATIPAIDDEIILEGIDVSFLSGSAITNAENELLAQANKDILETSKEDKVVDITLTSIDAYNRGRIALGTLTSLVGVLSSDGGKYDSRVLGFDECLDIPWDKPKYIIGDKNYYNRQASIESKLENIEKSSITLSGVNIGGGGSNIPIIKVKDSTKPTDANVYSALRSREEFAKRKEEETFSEKVTFNKDIDVKGSTKTKSLSVSNDVNIGGNQTIQGTQEVGGLQTLKGGFQTPNFNNAAGQKTGAYLTPDGKLYVSVLKANNLEIDELVFNVVKAQGGEYVYSTSCEIESCIYVMKDGSQLTPDAFYALADHDWQQISHVLITFKEDEFTKYGTPFEVGDIIYGKVNQVQESGKHAIGGECIMHITEVEDNTLNITAQLYQVGEHGLAGNIPPIEDMVIAHRGNKDGVQGRTTSFYLSTITGNLVMLYNVTTPTLSAENYGATFGKLPYDLYVQVLTHYAGLQPEDPVVYAKYLVTENWIQRDHLGQPIKFEVYRGDWRLDVAQSDKPYVVTLSTYDTVTHNGAKWRVCTSNTVKEPNDTFGDWERITDANITVYALAPSSNIIYIRDAGVITPSELDVTVKSTTSLGEEIISDQATLVGRSLTVWYTIDGGSERKMLVLGGTKVFVTEDGSSVFVTEADNVTSPLYLEGESIDLSKVSDNITLYLVENYPDNPTDKASYVIPVVNDGASPLGLELTPSALSVPVDAETQATAGVRSLTSIVRLKQGISYLTDLDEYSLSLTFTMTDGTTSDVPPLAYYDYIDYANAYDDEGNRIGWKVMVTTKDGISKGNLLELIGVIVKHNDSVVATDSISFVYLERGIAGPMGKDGPVIFPCGNWKAGTEYKMVYLKTIDANGNEVIATDEDGKKIILAKPFVYYKNASNDEYYVLNDDVPAGSDIQLSNTQYWKPFTKIQYIFTEALMAQYARLASAVFYGDYMFSVEGIDINGNPSDESKHQEDYLPMFINVAPEGEEPDMRFSGNFTPNLFIDFKTGAIKMNKISEPFNQAKNMADKGGSNIYKIDLDNGHNVTVQQAPYMVCMPNPTDILNADGSVAVSRGWDTDGVRSCIIVQPDFEYQSYKASGYLVWDTTSQGYVVAPYLTILCADGRIMDARSYKDGDFKPQNELEYVSSTAENLKTGQGYFVINGQLSKFLVLEPSAIVTLRSCTTKMGNEDVVYWYVENQSDFERVKLNVAITDYYTFECSYDGAGNSSEYSKEVAFGSKYLRTLLEAGGGFSNVEALNFYVSIDDNQITD